MNSLKFTRQFRQIQFRTFQSTKVQNKSVMDSLKESINDMNTSAIKEKAKELQNKTKQSP